MDFQSPPTNGYIYNIIIYLFSIFNENIVVKRNNRIQYRHNKNAKIENKNELSPLITNNIAIYKHLAYKTNTKIINIANYAYMLHSYEE